jgi:hypothetical protein
MVMPNGFMRFARDAALATALVGVIYSIAFVVVVQRGTSWAEWTAAGSLTVGGLLALPVLGAVTSLLADAPESAAAARLALTLGGVATVMTALHGAYDLAALAKPEAATAGDISPVDPRGFSTFALAGLTIVLIGVLARRDQRVPHWIPPVLFVLGAALVATWLGRVAVLDPTSAWLRITTSVAAVLNPVAYIGFASLCRRPVEAPRPQPATT